MAALTSMALLLGGVVAAPSAVAAVAAVPRPDHVVVLILENHSSTNILGNPDAPYINSLAATGANMTSSFGLTHPSQPNYIALFSGAFNGVADNNCPYSLSADNLGAQLIGSGAGFTGYSETLPGVGYTGCTSGAYARKHSPWINFTNVPASANRPLTDFPTDYSRLPAVSMVIPNLQHDMHDGSIAEGDAWIQDHLDGYVQWAKQHNSVFLLTFDEDDGNLSNQVPTIFNGQRIQPGTYPETIDHYDVLRTLQDAYGLPPIANSATASPILDIWTPEPSAPQPSFTATCVELTCSVNGSTSTAGPGSTLTSWRWTWGDGTVTTEPTTASHTYAAGGDFTVALQVTDEQGRTGQTSRLVSPRTAGSGVFAADAFNRTVSSGLGSADIGGAWTLAGSAANFSVAPGVASFLQPKAGSGQTAYLSGAKSTDTDLQMTVATNPLPNSNGLYLTMLGRRVGTNLQYEGRARVRGDGAVLVSLAMLTGTSTAVTLRNEVVASGVSVSAGSALKTRLQVVGTSPTTVRWKVWSEGTEPAGWQLTATDSTAALQTAGAVGITTYLSGSSTVFPVTAKFSAFSARTTTAVPANQPPLAAFTNTANNLAATFDGTTSSDPDGTIAGYAWDFGDSRTATGSKPSHTYANPGTYAVKLTVTDAQGATDSTTHPVTVTAPAQVTVASDDFSRTVGSGWGAADSGGAWTTSSAGNFAVSSGAGLLTLKTAGSGPSIYLNSATSSVADLQFTVAADKAATGGGYYVAAVGRRVASVGDYRAKVHVYAGGQARLALTFATPTNAETVLVVETVVPNLTVAAGDVVQVRFQATGTSSTTLRAKAWKVGSAEPATWTVSGTDSRAGMQTAGGVGVWTYISSSATNTPLVNRIDQVRVTRT